MNNDFEKNWEFSESHMPEIKSILKQNSMNLTSIEIADRESDLKYSTDLKIKIIGGDVAVRIRRGNIKYRDFTIRAYKDGYRTEFQKLHDGSADYYLYLWTNAQDVIDSYLLIDLKKMRDKDMFTEKRKVRMNKDGKTGFVVYSIAELKFNNVIIAKKGV